MNGWDRYAGWLVAPAVWAASTQFGQLTPYADCVTQRPWSAGMTAGGCALAAMAAGVSLLGTRRVAGTARFIHATSGLVGLLVTYAMLLQAVATFVIDPCLR